MACLIIELPSPSTGCAVTTDLRSLLAAREEVSSICSTGYWRLVVRRRTGPESWPSARRMTVRWTEVGTPSGVSGVTLKRHRRQKLTEDSPWNGIALDSQLARFDHHRIRVCAEDHVLDWTHRRVLRVALSSDDRVVDAMESRTSVRSPADSRHKRWYRSRTKAEDGDLVVASAPGRPASESGRLRLGGRSHERGRPRRPPPEELPVAILPSYTAGGVSVRADRSVSQASARSAPRSQLRAIVTRAELALTLHRLTWIPGGTP